MSKTAASNLFPILPLFLCFVGCSFNIHHFDVADEANLPGGYSKGDINSSETTDVAEFAVAEQSKLGLPLKLSSIVSVKTQVVAGTNHDLELLVVDGGVTKPAQAIVYTDLSQNRTLTAWTWK